MSEYQWGQTDKLAVYLNMPYPRVEQYHTPKDVADLKAELQKAKDERDQANRVNKDLRAQLDKLKSGRQHELERLRKEFQEAGSPSNALRMQANEAKREADLIRNLYAAFAKHDEGDLEGFDPNAPHTLVKLIESELRNGKKTTYAAICLVLLHRELQDVIRKNAILVVRNGKLASAIKTAAQIAVTN